MNEKRFYYECDVIVVVTMYYLTNVKCGSKMPTVMIDVASSCVQYTTVEHLNEVNE